MKSTKLSRYIIPSVISMVLVGTYTNIDGLFIGNVAGNPGLAAINFAWPIVAFITSLGTGIGIGGSVLLNRFRGRGDLYCKRYCRWDSCRCNSIRKCCQQYWSNSSACGSYWHRRK